MSLFSRFGRRMIAARESKARGHVYATLLAFDDKTLESAGYTREELRRKATTPYLL